MPLNENHVRELLEQVTPGTWEYKLEDGCIMGDLVEVLNGWIQADDGEMVLGTGLEINDDQEIKNLALAAIAPELASDWLRLRKELNKSVESLNYTATCTGSGVPYLLGMAEEAKTISKHLEKILNGDTNA